MVEAALFALGWTAAWCVWWGVRNRRTNAVHWWRVFWGTEEDEP